MHAKKRLELIIERLACKRACRILEAAGAKGYTLLPTQGGFGNDTRWERGVDLSASQDMVMIVCITEDEVVDKAVAQLGSLLGSHIGVFSVGDVQVMRGERF